jgi:hypothetical protein
MKVTLALLMGNGFPVPAPFVVGYSHLLQMLLTGAGNAALPADRKIDAARTLFVHDFPIDYARNRACKLFLDEDDGDYLLFLDTDMKHPPDLAHRLVRHGLDIVTGRYVMRRPPFFTVAMRKVGDGATEYQAVEKLEPVVSGLVPIDAGGAGALLLSRAVVGAVRDRTGGDWFRYQDGPDGFRSRSEDMWFYEQARACGYQAWLDADAVCQHVASFEVDQKWHEGYQREWLAQMARQEVPA